MWQVGQTVADVEKEAILSGFKHFRGNLTQTAGALNISINTLKARLDQYAGKEAPKDVEAKVELPRAKAGRK